MGIHLALAACPLSCFSCSGAYYCPSRHTGDVHCFDIAGLSSCFGYWCILEATTIAASSGYSVHHQAYLLELHGLLTDCWENLSASGCQCSRTGRQAWATWLADRWGSATHSSWLSEPGFASSSSCLGLVCQWAPRFWWVASLWDSSTQHIEQTETWRAHYEQSLWPSCTGLASRSWRRLAEYQEWSRPS